MHGSRRLPAATHFCAPTSLTVNPCVKILRVLKLVHFDRIPLLWICQKGRACRGGAAALRELVVCARVEEQAPPKLRALECSRAEENAWEVQRRMALLSKSGDWR